MWLTINSYLDNERFLLIAGRSLCICQKFETTCKDILMWLSATKYLMDNKSNLLDEDYLRNLNALMKLQLGEGISRSKRKLTNFIDSIDLETLDKGKVSRNYICHDLMKDLIAASFSERKKTFNFKEIKMHVINIAEADYLVSRWSYEFHEKESGAFFDKKKYVNDIINWVIPYIQ